MEKHPVTTNGIVYRNVNSFFGYNGWPTVCADEEGTLYAAWSGFRGNHVCPFGKTCLSKSFDKGKTWSVPMIVNDTWLDDRDGGIVCLGGKKMMITWFTNPAETYHTGRFSQAVWKPAREIVDELYPKVPEFCAGGGSYLRTSDDGGLTWGETVKMPVSAPHGPICCKDGSVLYLGTKRLTAAQGEDDEIVAMRSNDGGKTWMELGHVPLPDVKGIEWFGVCEPHVIELQDGTLLGAVRVERPEFSTCLTWSSDGGMTWTPLEYLDVLGAPPHIMQHSSGALIITLGYRHKPYGQRAIVSWDGGRTWKDEYILRDDGPTHDLGYPSTVELPDHKLLTVYYQAVPGDERPSILSTVWEL